MKTDLIILGGGPAGLTAGMYAARARIPLIIIERGMTGGQMAATEKVDNYPGFPDPVFGYDLAQKMESQAKKFGAVIHQADILDIKKTSGTFSVVTQSDEVFDCRAIIVATGASPVKLGIPGEVELAGRGVSYCAVCDGPFFSGFNVAVIGGGDSAVEEAIYLTRFAEQVHLIHRRDKLRAVKEIQEKAFAEPKIKIHWNSIPVKISGDKEVTAVEIRSTVDNSSKILDVGGVFFYVGIRPNAESINGLVETDQHGFVITDNRMACSDRVYSRPATFAQKS